MPGGLAELLNELAGARPTSSTSCTSGRPRSLHLDEVEVELQVETRGPEHADRVLAHLRDWGYTVTQ